MNNLRAILLVVFAMAAFAVEDLFVKQLSASVSVGQVLLTVGGGGALIFATLAIANRQNPLNPMAWTPVMLARFTADLVASIAFVTSLSLVELSTVAAVFQATPLAVTAGSALFLGESVGWRRWTAIAIGFFGVLMIVRPGFEGFNASALWVFFAVFGVAARDLLTRVASPNVHSLVLSVQGCLALVAAGVLAQIVTQDPLSAYQGIEIPRAIGAILFGAAGYFGLTLALRMGDPSLVAPFRYSRLVFSLVLGIVVLGESPDLLTLIGAVIVIGMGLYTFLRERRLARA